MNGGMSKRECHRRMSSLLVQLAQVFRIPSSLFLDMHLSYGRARCVAVAIPAHQTSAMMLQHVIGNHEDLMSELKESVNE